MLLHSGTPGRGDTAPPEFPQHTVGVAITGLRMLNHMATLDLEMMQVGVNGIPQKQLHIFIEVISHTSVSTNSPICGQWLVDFSFGFYILLTVIQSSYFQFLGCLKNCGIIKS